MRLLPFILVFVCACRSSSVSFPPPTDAFYYPSGMVYVDDPSTPDAGVLYVASSNFDRRYDFGTVIAVRPSNIPNMPAFGGSPGNLYRHNLNLGPNAYVITESFAGEIAARVESNGAVKLVVPTRGESSAVPVIQTTGPLESIACAFPGTDPTDCVTGAPSLVENQYSKNSLLTAYRAPGAFGVGLPSSNDPNPGDTFIAASQTADAPYGSGNNPTNYAVRFNVDALDQLTNSGDGKAHLADPSYYLNLGNDAAGSVVVGQRFAYVSGRFVIPQGALLRLIDRTGVQQPDFPAIEGNLYRALEARGVAMTSDETRLFVVTRIPDSLLVLSIQNPTAGAPTLNVINSIPLPPGPNFVHLIERAGRGPLAVVTSTNVIQNVAGTQDNLGTVVVYDDDVGQLVAEIEGIGIQPYGIAVQRIGGGARIFTGIFAEGRVAVLDMPDVNDPQSLRLVAYLGTPHECTIDKTKTVPSCSEESR